MAFQNSNSRNSHKGSGKAHKGGAGTKDMKAGKGKKSSPLASIKKAIFGNGKPAAPAKKAAPNTPTSHAHAHAPASAKKGGKIAAPTPPPAAQPAGKKGRSAQAPQKSSKKGGGLPRTSIHSTSFSGSRHAASDADSCREVACEGLATTAGYCRLHYIKNWKKIKRKELILKEGKLNQYIEELVAKYPDKYIDAIRQDLAVEKDFAKVIYDLDLDEGVDEFGDSDAEGGEALIDNIKREFEDEGEGGF